jgi:hypothetical protein
MIKEDRMFEELFLSEEMKDMLTSGEFEKCPSSNFWADEVKKLDAVQTPSSWNPFGVNARR